MPLLAFPPILAGDGLAKWLVLLGILLVVGVLGRVVYRMLREEP